jgi:ferric-dicitrate binding protein FerR (iron transport regulator)
MKKLFAKYLQSVCTSDEFKEITSWFSKTENNRSFTDIMKPFWDRSLLEETEIPVNTRLWDNIKKEVEEQETASIRRRLGIYTWGFRAAAVLVAALLISNLFLLFNANPVKPSLFTQTVTVPLGARSDLMLPDGSHIWLNSGTTISYFSDFSEQRVLNLDGEAYFDVIKNESEFLVQTISGNVEVTGTAFNVKAFSSDNLFETTVEKGSVVVRSDRTGKPAILKAGEQGRFADGRWELGKVETDLFTSWKDGKIIFRKEYLPDVAKRLERWYNVKIELDDDPMLSKIHYTGTLEMESFSEVLELLKITAPIRYTYNDKTRVIKITHRR